MTTGNDKPSYLKDGRLWIVIAAFAAPVVDTFVCFGPPWPSMSISVAVAIACEILAFALSWAMISRWYEGAHKIRWWLTALGVVLVLAFASKYVSLASRYVCQVYGSTDRYVIGSQYISERMEEFAASDPSKYTPEGLIGEYHNVESVWSQDSLAKNRRGLLISWYACWLGLGLVVSNTLVVFREGEERKYTATIEPSLQAREAWGVGPKVPPQKAVALNGNEKAAGSDVQQEVVLLIHGIRTQAEWQDMVADVLGQIPDALVWPLKYEFFDAVRFWFPLATRDRPIGEILWRIREARRRYPTARLSVIAHSFGTYATGMILRDNQDISLHRLVLCGSVLPRGFRWDRIGRQIDKEVINDCGMHDVWPVLAECASWGYGASGTYGFGTPGIHDRYHDIRHSGFFRRSFVKKFWVPWFQSGERRPGIASRRRPYLWSLMTVFRIRWILAAIPFVLAGWLWFLVF